MGQRRRTVTPQHSRSTSNSGKVYDKPTQLGYTPQDVVSRRSSELQPGRVALGSGPARGTMQSLRPVRCCRQVDWLRIQAILPDAGLGKLDRVRIVRRDGMFNDFRLVLRRPVITFGRPDVGVRRGRRGDVLPDIG